MIRLGSLAGYPFEGPRVLAHRAEQRPDADRTAVRGHAASALREPRLDSLDHRIE